MVLSIHLCVIFWELNCHKKIPSLKSPNSKDINVFTYKFLKEDLFRIRDGHLCHIWFLSYTKRKQTLLFITFNKIRDPYQCNSFLSLRFKI